MVPAAARGRWARAALIAGVAVPRAFPEASAVPSRKNGFELRAGSTGVREVRAPINEVLTPLGALSPCASVAALVACAVCEGPPPNAAPARTPGPALGCENGETAGRARRMPDCVGRVWLVGRRLAAASRVAAVADGADGRTSAGTSTCMDPPNSVMMLSSPPSRAVGAVWWDV